jgi:hypothetical protein
MRNEELARISNHPTLISHSWQSSFLIPGIYLREVSTSLPYFLRIRLSSSCGSA